MSGKTTNRPTDWKLVAQLFWSFFKIGPVTFGGGYAMIPLIEQEVVGRRRWMKEEEIADVLAVSQSAPGAVAINSATFIGYKMAGVKGAVAAMLGIQLPTFCIVVAMCLAFLSIRDNQLVDAAFAGIRPAVVALIVYAGFRVGRNAVFDWTTRLLMLGSVAFLMMVPVNPVLVIVLGALFGILAVELKRRLGIGVELAKSTSPGYDPEEGYMYGDGI